MIGQGVETEHDSVPTLSEMYYKSPSQLFFEQPEPQQVPCSVVFKECRGKVNGD